jgi:hypothetical protein
MYPGKRFVAVTLPGSGWTPEGVYRDVAAEHRPEDVVVAESDVAAFPDHYQYVPESQVQPDVRCVAAMNGLAVVVKQ